MEELERDLPRNWIPEQQCLFKTVQNSIHEKEG